MKDFDANVWPELPYKEFQSTAHLLHMCVQMVGKLKLHTPFEPHWANVALWLRSNGLTTGLIPFKKGFFSIDLDLITHQLQCTTSLGKSEQIPLAAQSVSELYMHLFDRLKSLEIDLIINTMPQEIPSPIPFEKDIDKHDYNNNLANAWWRILLNSYRVMQRYHARFNGETPAIGLMWGTFDIRDARYNGIASEPTGINAGYIRRNAMDEGQIEIGWWHGNEAYPRAAFYSYTYPQPKEIELANIQPKEARWDKTLQEFILDYDDLRKAKDPDSTLLSFFESTYQAGSRCANWDPQFITKGEPV